MPQIRGIQVPKESNLKNYLINAHMRLSPRGSSFVSPLDGAYSLDRWRYGKASTATHTISQDTDVPTFAQSGYQFTNSLRMNLTSADTSIAAGDIVVLSQYVEGNNFVAISQKPCFLSFWVKATLTGTYCVALRNSGRDRSYIAEYVINSSNTWEFKTISIPSSPSGGTWNYGEGVGVEVNWTLAAGTTFQTTAGSWQTGNFVGTSNQVNGVNTGATDFRITGTMLNEGIVASPFRLFSDGYVDEYLACQRYYEIGRFKHFYATAGNKAITQTYRVPKRTTPTLSFSGANSPTATELNDLLYFQVLRGVSDFEIAFDWTSAAEL